MFRACSTFDAIYRRFSLLFTYATYGNHCRKIENSLQNRITLSFIPLNSKGVYGGKVTDDWDRRFVEILTHHVIKETALQQHSSLSVGTVSLPVPPANVDPSDYSKWFNEKTSTDGADVSAVRALELDVSVEREYNESL